jgi:PAS domain S-box-containing protein
VFASIPKETTSTRAVSASGAASAAETIRLAVFSPDERVGTLTRDAMAAWGCALQYSSRLEAVVHPATTVVVLDDRFGSEATLRYLADYAARSPAEAPAVVLVSADASVATHRAYIDRGADDVVPAQHVAEHLCSAVLAHHSRRSLLRATTRSRGWMVLSELDDAPFFIGACDLVDGRFGFINAFGRSLARLPEDEGGNMVENRTLDGIFRPPAASKSFLDLLHPRTDRRSWTGLTILESDTGEPRPIFLTLLRTSPERPEAGRIVVFGRDYSERLKTEAALRESEALLHSIMDNAEEAICLLDTAGLEVWCNPSFARLMPSSGYETRKGARFVERIHPSDHPALAVAIDRAQATGRSGTFELRTRDRAGDVRHFEANICLVNEAQGDADRLICIARDVTDRKRAEHNRTMTRILLDEAQRLESIGRLASGIAHEINTPTQFVGDNLRFLKSTFADLVGVFDDVEAFVASAETIPELGPRIQTLTTALAHADLPYARAEIPAALDQSIEGIQRVAKIVHAMREFSHPGSPERVPADINRAIESTSVVARNEWKYVADLVLELAPDLGEVSCVIGELNQVVLNLIVNAAHAIADRIGSGSGDKGLIKVSTTRSSGHVEIRVSDNGAGIPPEVQKHLFEPFFTTKPVGRGTGQGLAIARSVVVDRHGGDITYETAVGRGTCFIVRLPLEQPPRVPIP